MNRTLPIEVADFPIFQSTKAYATSPALAMATEQEAESEAKMVEARNGT